MEYVDHLPPELAGLLAEYHSTCSTLTEDGKKCGLGNNGGFQFKLSNGSEPGQSNQSSEQNNCQHECASDLCPQWLESLFGRIPSVVVLTDLKTGEMLETSVASVSFATSDGLWDRRLSYSDPSMASLPIFPPISGSIASLCRVLNAPRKNSISLNATIQLARNTPNLQNVSASFPEFEGGNYFVPSPAWKFGFTKVTPRLGSATLFASLIILPRE